LVQAEGVPLFDEIDPRSPVPLYEQIAGRLRVAVASSEYRAGEPLPSVRQLASMLRVNPSTVVQAYRDLEREGFVEMRHGAGTYVKELATAKRSDERRKQARELVRRLLADAARVGISTQDLAEAFDAEKNGAP
jgi:GntR family transcriptional regulator